LKKNQKENGAQEKRLLKLKVIVLLPFLLLLPGCSFLPFPFELIGVMKSTYDAFRIIQDEKTSNDEIISRVKNKECKTRNVLPQPIGRDEEYCKEKQEKKFNNN